MTSISVRDRLAIDTRALHQALHDDPLLGALTGPSISEQDYRRSLLVFAAFHAGIEADRRRLAGWQSYALTPVLRALAADGAVPPKPSATCGLMSHGELMGGLYVAYGALLGRAVMKRPVTTALPQLAHVYIAMPFPTSEWRALCRDLESQVLRPEGYPPLRKGAVKAFQWMRQLLLPQTI